MFDSISDYKGLILITFIIIAVLYFSPDLECMLLFTGIIVNIITICLNTGALKISQNGKSKFSSNSIPDTFINPKQYDKVEEYFTDRPNFDDLIDPRLAHEVGEVREIKLEKKEVKIPQYKGAIDYNDVSEPMQVATDRIPMISTSHQGANSRRQLAGTYNRRKVLYPAIARELEEEESKPWWGTYDVATSQQDT